MASEFAISKSTLTNIADAIREKTETETLMTPLQMPSKIRSISGGGSGVQSVEVTQIQSTGTKIATIDVDGTSTDLYAPEQGVADAAIAPVFSTSEYYYPNALVIYEGALYRCIAAHEAAAWNAAHFTAVSISDELSAAGYDNAALTQYYHTHGIQKVAFPFRAGTTYVVGDYVVYAGGLYRNLTGVTGSDPSIDTTNWEYLPPARIGLPEGGTAGQIVEQTANGPAWSDGMIELNEAIDQTALAINVPTSGSLVHFEDGADDKPMKCTVSVEPVQDLHGYENPWPAGGGANKWDEQWESGSIYPASGNPRVDATAIRSANYINVVAGNTYYGFIGTTGVQLYIAYWEGESYLSGGDRIDNRTFTVPTGATKAKIWTYGGEYSTYKNDIAINYPSTVTTYSPYSNICPITGWTGATVTRTGKNLLPESEYETNATGVTNKYVTANGKLPSGTKITASSICTDGTVPTASICQVQFRKGGVSQLNTSPGLTVTLANDVEYDQLLYYTTATLAGKTIRLQIEIGETATAYEPYQGNTYSVTWTESGTVYGGSVDLDTGVLTVDRICESKKWKDLGNATDLGTNERRKFIFSNAPKYTVSGASDDLKSNIIGTYNATFGLDGIHMYIANSEYAWVYLPDTTDSETVIQLSYSINTPLTIQLSPVEARTLLGINNVWANTGDISVVYQADTKQYIDNSAVAGGVSDVQVNGTSIVSNGVANVPKASPSTWGAVLATTAYGLDATSSGLRVYAASDGIIKAATGSGSNYQPITPYRQHTSVFYGLAKAAGDTTQSASENAVGTYTDEAKEAIQDMLGVTDEIDGVKSAVENSAPIITSSSSGSLVHIEDGADNRPMSGKVNIEPVQDLHGYANPWPGGGGENLLDIASATAQSASYGITKTIDSDGYIHLDGTVTATGATMSMAIIKASSAQTAAMTGLGYVISAVDVSGVTVNNAWGLRDVDNGAIAVSVANPGEGVEVHGKLRIVVAPTAKTSWSPYSNICPITGWTGAVVTRTGKNLIDDTKRYYIATTTYYIGATDGDYHIQLKAGTYTISCDTNNVSYGMYMRGQNDIANTLFWASGSNTYKKTFTILSDGVYRFWFYRSVANGGIDTSNVKYVMLEFGSTATEYEPYQGNTYPISWTESGTVYGGSVDLDTGVLTVDRVMLTLNTDDATNDTFPGWRDATEIRNIVGTGINGVVSGISDFTNATIRANTTGNNRTLFFNYSDLGMTAAELKAAMPDTDVHFVLTLVTPLTIQLSPVEIRTLLGTNNIWADTGDMAVEYPADTKLYIQELTKPTEDDLIANTAITSGKFFMIGNNLYRATAAIASGATITPGTNATKMSLADALNLLNS